MRESLKGQQDEFCLDQFHLLPDPFFLAKGLKQTKILQAIQVLCPLKKKKKKKKKEEEEKERKEKIKKGSGARLV